MHPTKQAAKKTTTPSGNPGAGTRANATITRSPGNKKKPGDFDWVKFWIEMGIYGLIFNIVAGLITWYYLFPKLHLR